MNDRKREQWVEYLKAETMVKSREAIYYRIWYACTYMAKTQIRKKKEAPNHMYCVYICLGCCLARNKYGGNLRRKRGWMWLLIRASHVRSQVAIKIVLQSDTLRDILFFHYIHTYISYNLILRSHALNRDNKRKLNNQLKIHNLHLCNACNQWHFHLYVVKG